MKGNEMNYAEIKTADVANGPGIRTSLFVSGCTHHCKGCFNECTWSFNYGKPFTKEVEAEIIESLKPAYVTGLTVLGGEPMEVVNQRALTPFIRNVREMFPNKSIWLYSGYAYEEITDTNNKRCNCDVTDELLSCLDVLVDGEFKQELKNISLKFRGSENQRLIDVQKTSAANEIVLYK